MVVQRLSRHSMAARIAEVALGIDRSSSDHTTVRTLMLLTDECKDEEDGDGRS